MARVIAICTQKGGVGKTTSTINIGAELAAVGHRVLLVDMDSQGHVAEGFGLVAHSIPKTLYHVLSDQHRVPLAEVIQPLTDNLHLVPSNAKLAGLDLELASMVRREDRLKMALQPVQDSYDLILIDCAPSLGLMTVNAFSAANEVLLVMSCEFNALLGVAETIKTITEMKKLLNPELTITGILPTRNKRISTHGQQVIDRAREEFPDVAILEPSIHETITVEKASALGQPLMTYAPTSEVRREYQQIAKELCQDGH